MVLSEDFRDGHFDRSRVVLGCIVCAGPVAGWDLVASGA